MISIFTSARLKLTVFYTLIIFLISGAISVLFYLRTSQVLADEYERIEQRLQMEMEGFIPSGPRPFLQRIQLEDLQNAQRQLAVQLLRINGVILIIVAGAGYFLSGLTLKPIQQAMEDQKRFVGDAAHELRTPLTALKTSLEVNLMDKSLPQKAKKILYENLDDVSSLESLTSSLLKLAKFDNKGFQFKKVNLDGVIQAAIKQVQPLLKNKKMELETRLDSRIFVWGDRTALCELVVIFLDNAIKYSEEKSLIQVKIRAAKSLAEIVVQDKGIGIDPDHLPHIFERFYQADSSRTNSKATGYGLGLSVAKKIVEEHHGTIGVNSHVGQGSEFVVRLPLVM